MGFWDDIKRTFSSGSSLMKLIYINIAVFLVITLASIIGFLINSPDLSDKVLYYLSVPSSPALLLTRPWTLITYMFAHKGIWHILFNMLWLYWFGKIFLEYLDQRKLVAVYLMGGIIGALVYILSFNLFPVFATVVSDSMAVGASASVMAIVVAIAAYVPDYTVMLFLFGRIKIKYLALVIFILTSALDFSTNSGGKLAHIGGALFGYVYSLNLKRGKDLGRGFNHIIDFFVTIFRPRNKLKVTHKRPANEYEYNQQRAEHQEKINKILEKISKGGYDSLTREEKDLLFRESQKKN